MIIVFFFASLLLSCLPVLHSATNHNTSIPICPKSFTCPNLEPFSYPFYNANDTKCGLIKVNCTSNGTNLEFRGELYEVGGNYRSHSRPSVLVLVLNKKFEKLVNDKKCEALEYNFTSPSPLMYSSSITPFTNIYKCSNNTNHAEEMVAYFNQSTYNRYSKCKPYNFYYKYNISDTTFPSDLPPTCEVIRLPVKLQWNTTRVPDKTNIFSVLSFQFSITFELSSSCDKCRKKDGQCHAPNGQFQCLGVKKENPLGKLKHIPVLAGSAFIIILFIVISIIWCRYKNSPFSYFSSKGKSPHVEDGSIFFGVSVFSYTELEDATQNFDPSLELGNGGFGAVYYGKLQDGREVAVKRLYEHSYKRVQQFVNEIRILTRLRHPNLVVLYGCTSRQSHELLLVYEYISNGTVADHLHGKQANSSLLTWPLRMNIAIETARALVYLHASEIIHRDVKTCNILLDQNFSAKVADFGLSRLLPNDVTHVSTAPQGTPGYVDPQYHHCYQLTDKSDVYSFGVVLIELISSMVAVDLSRSQDEISLADLALNRIQRCALDQLIDPDLGSDSDAEIMRMITSVAELAFQCLQYYSEMRPTMSEVLDVLEDIQAPGRIDSIKPPTPSETSDKTVLLKDFLPSPVSVTGEWHSESTVSTTLSIR
ncbi:LEAF RUST 10 DISEASE-RESISTANCE LOCUS RECEPTOR-LIKE PROTEIN KINASE-like 1.1 [Lactuca sativa]|uniref:Protein kinase domain-containing protein n=1 Tax=Lactuca sativa TaxID=4236 RepID=A0A9R1W9N9_LACSA|nr:LEAF RUST 10 DISEASE-RESISTANCE LOCUS RECEPTOR-LIKE PROTEIN KINASE-like 1.1 [Lactuca sativa]KAJ0218408.1 hypothetical protein LSAT_V11C300124230 [Lactuca sativa]